MTYATKQNKIKSLVKEQKVRCNCSANSRRKVVYIFEFEVVDDRWVEQTKSEYRGEGRYQSGRYPSFILAIEIARSPGLLLFKGQAR